MPFTEGERKTLAYLEEQFKEIGLEPGNGSSYLQEVPLVEITPTADSVMHIKASGQALALRGLHDYVINSQRTQEEVRWENVPMVFAGFGVVAPEYDWNDYDGLDVKDKIVIVLVNDPGFGGDDSTFFKGNTMTYYGRWTYKFEEAARQGAAGALIVHDSFPASYGWNVVQSSWSGPQAYAQRADGGASQTLVNGWVQKPVAEEIVRAAGHDLAELSAAAKRPGFRPVPLGVTASTGFDNAIRRFASKNVIGILPGRERPDEYVLHTAHWDHLGRCTANAEGDDICNGAIDNATGTAALVALGEAHARAGPAARTLVFLAVTAEESGLLGSEYYGANPVFPLERTVGGLNMDALSLAGPARDVTVVGGGKSELDAYLERALAALDRAQSPDPSPQAGYYYRSDHFSLAKRGVPMFYIDSGQDLVDGGREAGAAWDAAYRDNAYHGPDDEYDPNWDWSGALQDVQLFYRLGRMLAESDDWPNWYPDDEFRRVRDESCAPAGGC